LTNDNNYAIINIEIKKEVIKMFEFLVFLKVILDMLFVEAIIFGIIALVVWLVLLIIPIAIFSWKLVLIIYGIIFLLRIIFN
jgi:hypothetical protein